MTDGARQVSFSNQNFFPLLSSLLPSKHEQKHASNKQKKLLEGVGKKENKNLPSTKPENCTFTALEPKTVFQFSSSAFEPFKRESHEELSEKKNLKSEIKKISLASLD